jgi:hypothetical protein
MIYNISYTQKYIENVRALPQHWHSNYSYNHSTNKNMHDSIMKMKPEIDYSTDTVTHKSLNNNVENGIAYHSTHTIRKTK